MGENFDVRAKNVLEKDRYGVYDLAEIVSLLRSENGCPWDKVQTHSSLVSDMIEEAYEVVEAIECGSAEMLCEELGDVMLQVAFHADIEKDKDVFDLDGVADRVCKKLILRHPHVFGSVKADTADEVLKNWDAIKKEEKEQKTYADTLKSVPKVFPALLRAQKLTKRASRAGIELSDRSQMAKLIRQKLDAIVSGDASEEDMGKLLMLCAGLAGSCGYDAERSLADECGRFIERFETLERGETELSGICAEELYK